MNLRKWNNIIHRDLGYLMFGLTVVYAISGFILNHKHDFNPNFAIHKETVRFEAVADLTEMTDETVAGLVAQIGSGDGYTGYFRPKPETVKIFYPEVTYTLDLKTGVGESETIRDRKVIKELNYLHLNLPQKVWTWVADFYAFALLLLAITGLFVLKGKKGIKGRGAWLTAAGVLIPIIFILIYLV